MLQFQVLQGYVSSVEDHGYLISFGIEDTRAFLPKKNLTRGTCKCILDSIMLIKNASSKEKFVIV